MKQGGSQAQDCGSRVILALDYSSEPEVMRFIEPLSPDQCRLKVGKQLFTACGPQLVKTLVSKGYDVFLDLKFHDIPNTVAKALLAARDLGVWMINVHASGGPRMLDAARAAYSASSDPILIAVTVLTSMSADELSTIGIDESVDSHVLRLARLAANSGMDGLVCSAHEAPALKQAHGSQFCLVTPGIRPPDSMQDDQSRILSPVEALKNGSDYLVIGRPITQSADPAQTLKHINDSIGVIS